MKQIKFEYYGQKFIIHYFIQGYLYTKNELNKLWSV